MGNICYQLCFEMLAFHPFIHCPGHSFADAVEMDPVPLECIKHISGIHTVVQISGSHFSGSAGNGAVLYGKDADKQQGN